MTQRTVGFLLGALAGALLLGAFFVGVKTSSNSAAPKTPTPSTDVDRKAPDTTLGTDAVVGKPMVKLAVLVVFDQMRGDFLDRWKNLYTANGFNRMTSAGTHFTNCHYPYGITSTGPGHASMLTGCSPDRHGITNNDWFDRATATKQYCAGSERYAFVPAKPVSPTSTVASKSESTKVAGCPVPMLSPTVGDVLKKATGGKGRAFGLSLKDRSAVLPAGHAADGAYWFDGRIVTSTYYRDTVHSWIAELNRSKIMDQWFEKPWTKLHPDWDYTQFSGPDDGLGETKTPGRGITFPHSMTGGLTNIGKEYYEQVANSPYGNDLVLAMAKACVVGEGLGTRETPDLLTISFSSNDIVGHAYGPDSHEVLDVTLRSDLIMAELLSFLDERVGKGNYVVAMTADHGVVQIPELAAALGKDAKRVPAISLLLNSERHLQSKFGKLNGGFETKEAEKRDTWIETISAPWLYLNDRLCAAKGVNKADVAREYVAWLRGHPDVMSAYTAEELAKPDALDANGQFMARSFHPKNSGDLCVVLKPGYLIESKVGGTGTSHGTPHDYDRFVPLVVFGPKLNPGPSDEPVTPQHCAAILSHYLGLAPPRDCAVTLPKTLMKKNQETGTPAAK
jgi:hypothetical protein